MPHPSLNSSSGFSKQEPNEYRKYTQPEDNAESFDLQNKIETPNKAQDWHYGTEELLDALPRLWTRSLLYVLFGFIAIALPWSMLSKVDETGNARGRIEPKGATQKLDTPASGSITFVRVKEGETVKAGQVLLELDSDVLKTQLEQANLKLEGLQNRQSSLEILKNQLIISVQTQKQQNQAQQLAKLSQIEQVQQNLNTLKATYNFQKAQQLAKVDQTQQALGSGKAVYKVAEISFRGAQEKVPRYKKAYEQGVISQDRFSEIKQLEKENYELLLKAKTEISQAQSSLQEQQNIYQKTLLQAQSEIQQASLRLQQEQRNYQSLIHAGKLAELQIEAQLKELQTQINSLKSEIAQTRSEIISIKIQLRQRVVRSPIDGVIFELPITKAGAVVQIGQRIAQIAPEYAGLVLKANMPNTKSGFMKVGMPVKIKFDAYPFQEYGIVEGKLNWISPDSKVRETPQGNIETYELEITLKQPYIKNGDKHIPLTAGQTATAEVIVRQRRMIDYMLDPFKKFQKSGLEL
ncbi:MAG: HlyD family efflux transporter periplasmic adaptor subunit [Nostoc sp.]|uniref:HlyD family efflux transporter periplasmic adaptor subunit n=1 Tax=Nostoc sp. TaxID=1180 RepID=UPI002FF735E2